MLIFDDCFNYLITIPKINKWLNSDIIIKNYLFDYAMKHICINQSILKHFVPESKLKSIDFTDNGQNYSFVEKVELVAKNNFIAYAAQAGFTLVDLKGDYRLAPFDEAVSPRMIFVWAKTKTTTKI